jgi:aspartyl aminopeptidase
MAKKNNKKLEKELFYRSRSAWIGCESKKVLAFSEDYKRFLDSSKTERECARSIIRLLEKKGYRQIDKFKKLKRNDKVYKQFKNRVVMAARIGKNPEMLRIIGSHMDSPRLDLKPRPIYEDSALVMLKTHYYGGLKKYHWVNVPLSLHAVVHTKKGRKEIVFGESEDEPKLIIPDLEIHLAREQMDKKLREGITGEQLNVVIANKTIDDDDIKEAAKLSLLKILSEKYNILEEDLQSADVELTPAGKATDIGFDSSMISAYGQDDRVCVFTSLLGLLDSRTELKNTGIAYFVDKEEVGSFGDTGAQSRVLENFVEQLLDLTGSKKRKSLVFEDSASLSADVTVAVNPNFSDVNDKTNASFLGHGVSIEKYGGAGGKYHSNDASSEFMSWLLDVLKKKDIRWQTGELGKIDAGGGGTIAMFMAKLGMDCIDVGPPVLSMHSTAEVTSKVDIYNAYLAYKAFFEN